MTPVGSGFMSKYINLTKIIEEKIKTIEEKTNEKVVLEEIAIIKASAGAALDFEGWNSQGKKNLPKILHKKNVREVDILHELIHLEKYFVGQYSLIACNSPSLYKIIDVYKNIPEDYVAHKVIKYHFGLNPIDEQWFRGKDNLDVSDGELLANLIQYSAFSEYCPQFKQNLSRFLQNCERSKKAVFTNAYKAISMLEKMRYEDKDSYNQCANEIIKIFSPSEYDNNIYLSYLYQNGDKWRWSR